MQFVAAQQQTVDYAQTSQTMAKVAPLGRPLDARRYQISIQQQPAASQPSPPPSQNLASAMARDSWKRRTGGDRWRRAGESHRTSARINQCAERRRAPPAGGPVPGLQQSEGAVADNLSMNKDADRFAVLLRPGSPRRRRHDPAVGVEREFRSPPSNRPASALQAWRPPVPPRSSADLSSSTSTSPSRRASHSKPARRTSTNPPPASPRPPLSHSPFRPLVAASLSC